MWQQTLDFIVQGGAALSNYPEYRKVVRGDDGVYRVHDRAIAMRHRLSIGTITSDSAVDVRFLKGKRLGSIEEAFLSRLRPGDRFQFAGRMLDAGAAGKHVGLRARRENRHRRGAALAGRTHAAVVGTRRGSRAPAFAAAQRSGPEMLHLRALLDTQKPDVGAARASANCSWSGRSTTRNGSSRFIRSPVARSTKASPRWSTLRWSRAITTTFAYAANDYGFIIALPRQTLMDTVLLRELLSPQNLIDDLLACVNVGELSRRQFREIARIAGLLPPSLPGRKPRSAAASAGVGRIDLRRAATLRSRTSAAVAGATRSVRGAARCARAVRRAGALREARNPADASDLSVAAGVPVVGRTLSRRMVERRLADARVARIRALEIFN